MMYNYYSASIVSARLSEPLDMMEDSVTVLADSNLKIAAEAVPYLNYFLYASIIYISQPTLHIRELFSLLKLQTVTKYNMLYCCYQYFPLTKLIFKKLNKLAFCPTVPFGRQLAVYQIVNDVQYCPYAKFCRNLDLTIK